MSKELGLNMNITMICLVLEYYLFYFLAKKLHGMEKSTFEIYDEIHQ